MHTDPHNTCQGFKDNFHEENKFIFYCGGRFELLGNHTDHNHGLCLAATCDLQITAAVNVTNDNQVTIISAGYEPFTVSLDDLNIHEEEINTSAALVRGVAKYYLNHGYKIGGFKAYTFSDIFKGAGVSSSAAFEVLVAHIFNVLYNNQTISNLEMAKAGQYAENNYFGKASGLLDQIGVAFGNAVYIDFNHQEAVVESIEFPFTDLHFVIVNTGGSHAELSDLYSSIPNDMYNAAHKMDCHVLAESNLEKLESIKEQLTPLEYSRSIHFYNENKRVLQGLHALKTKNKEKFIAAINESRLSSTNNLKNMMVDNNYKGSPLEACDFAMKITNGKGAAKINGGGFAGSIICVVPDEYYENFMNEMLKAYGDGNVKEVHIGMGPRFTNK